MRLNWFSPLPPARTDIAHYSARIAAARLRRFEVIFWTDADDAAGLPPGAEIRRFAPAWFEDRDLRRELFQGLNVYNLGNDARFHRGIARMARTIPGVVILHDARLHHFAFEAAREDSPPFAGYLSLARSVYGAEGEVSARRIVASAGRLIDDHVEDMPFVELFLENAIGAVCHAAAASAEIRRLTDIPLLTLPLPFVSLAPPPQAARVWAPPWRFVMFGYVNPNRRLESVLRALGGGPGAPDFRLDIYGTLWDPTLIERLIRDVGLAGRVFCHGFAPEAELDAAIAGAHLAFNLRHPTMGEASGGILRSWALATPALVTDAGWYADLPDAVCRKISIEDEILDIRRAVTELARDPLRYAEVGEAGRRRLAEAHAPSAYVEALSTALSDRERLMGHFAARKLAAGARRRAPSQVEWAAQRSPRRRLGGRPIRRRSIGNVLVAHVGKYPFGANGPTVRLRNGLFTFSGLWAFGQMGTRYVARLGEGAWASAQAPACLVGSRRRPRLELGGELGGCGGLFHEGRRRQDNAGDLPG